MIVKIKFNDMVVKSVQEAPDFNEFCLKFGCEAHEAKEDFLKKIEVGNALNN